MKNEFIEVSKEEFYATVGKQNVHPYSFPDRSEWKHCISHEIIGITYPGYKCVYGTPNVYKIRADLKAKGE